MPKRDTAQVVILRFLRCVLAVLLGSSVIGMAAAAAHHSSVRVVYGFQGGTAVSIPRQVSFADATGALYGTTVA